MMKMVNVIILDFNFNVDGFLIGFFVTFGIIAGVMFFFVFYMNRKLKQNQRRIETEVVPEIIAQTKEKGVGNFTIGDLLATGKWNSEDLKLALSFLEKQRVVKKMKLKDKTILYQFPGTKFIPTTTMETIPIAKGEMIDTKRQYEFLGGFVRIKLKLINTSDKVITNLKVNIDIPPSLKLMKVEPQEYYLKNEISIPNLQFNSEKTLNIYIEPLICGKEKIYGNGKYLDASGVQHLFKINPLEINITCPMFFTEEEVNVARVNHLMQHELSSKDERSYCVPEGLDFAQLYHLLKESIQKHHLKLVYEDIKQEPTFKALVYYYGKTKIKKNYFVIQGMVNKENRALRVIVAANDESQLTGLLAEIGSDLRTRIVQMKLIESEGKLISLRCPCCAAPLKKLPEKGETCPYCDGVILY